MQDITIGEEYMEGRSRITPIRRKISPFVVLEPEAIVKLTGAQHRRKMKIKFENNSNSKMWISDFCLYCTSIADAIQLKRKKLKEL